MYRVYPAEIETAALSQTAATNFESTINITVLKESA
jgi:hypothetical protein